MPYEPDGFQPHVLSQSNIPSNHVSPNVNSGASPGILIAELSNDRIGSLDREKVGEDHISALGPFTNLESCHHRVSFVCAGAEIPDELDIGPPVSKQAGSDLDCGKVEHLT